MTDKERMAYVRGFEDAVNLLDIPKCPYCGSKLKIGYACGESFIVPEGITEGKGCGICRHIPMHSWIKQVLEDWKEIREKEG